jgi:transcriptional regulator with XRE-family HTH domain
MHPIVQAIRDHAREQGMSNKDLAIRASTAAPNISNWFRGVGNPSIDRCERLAKAAGLTLTLSTASESDERLAQLVLAMNRLAIAKTAEERKTRRDELVRAGRKAKDYLSSIGIEAEARL